MANTHHSPSGRPVFTVQPKGSRRAPNPKQYRPLSFKRVRKSGDALGDLYAAIAKARSIQEFAKP